MSGNGPFAQPPGRSVEPPAPPPPPPPPPPHPTGGAQGAPPPYSWTPTNGRKPRRRTLQLAIGIVVAGAVVGAAVAVPLTVLNRQPSSSTSPSPASGSAAQAATAYRQAMTAMRSAAGFHYVAVVNGGGNQRTVGDAGQSGGRQDITLTSSFGAERFTLLLVDGTVYFQGNVPAFQDQLGVPASRASALQNSWVSVVKGDGPYAVLAVGITTSDQADETPLVPSSVTTVTVSGASALRVEGRVPPQQGAPPGTGHLDVAAKDHHALAYAARVSDGTTTVSSTVSFSDWGKAPSVSAPSGAVAWSSLPATPPPGGYGSGGGPAGSATPGPAI